MKGKWPALVGKYVMATVIVLFAFMVAGGAW